MLNVSSSACSILLSFYVSIPFCVCLHPCRFRAAWLAASPDLTERHGPASGDRPDIPCVYGIEGRTSTGREAVLKAVRLPEASSRTLVLLFPRPGTPVPKAWECRSRPSGTMFPVLLCFAHTAWCVYLQLNSRTFLSSTYPSRWSLIWTGPQPDGQPV